MLHVFQVLSSRPRSVLVKIFLAAVFLIGITIGKPGVKTSVAQEINYDESRMPKFELPDPLKFQAGKTVTSAADWPKRRTEILELFQQHVYGQRPETAFQVQYESQALAAGPFGNDVTVNLITLKLRCQERETRLPVLLILPKSERPVPVFLGPNFQGNYTISHHPEVPLPDGWVPDRLHKGEHVANEQLRGTAASRWPVKAIVEAGYGLATVYSGDIDPDFDDGFRNGVHYLLEGDDQKADWGTISAWAWGLSQVMTYLQTDSRIDGDRVIVIGHSRLGKTALWAGATDSRFAAVVSNNSGCGGAALSRRRIGESVYRINESFPHWFNQKFKEYNDNEDQCPVDQHQLIAAIAPRPVYIASATEDRWADPKGEFQSGVLATPVYQLLGTEGLTLSEFPAPEQPCHSIIGYHLRSGKHDITAYDWQQYLHFADQHLGK